MGPSMPLRIALNDNPYHKAALTDGLTVAGYDVTTVPLAPGEMYSRAFEDDSLDASEMSIARYAGMKAQDQGKFVAIPYYFARVFPHSTFYVRADSRIHSPADMAGCTVGLSEYDHTGHTWARALLQDEYGVAPSAVKWMVARRESTRPPIRHFFVPPSDVVLTNAAPEKYLSKMLLDGEIDVLINPHTPGCFVEHPDQIRRLIANHETVERQYFERTGICPIQHVFGVRRELARQDPELAAKLVLALTQTIGASRQLWKPQGPGDQVPVVAMQGLGRNEEASLITFLRHHHSQGLSSRQMTLEDFFQA